MQWTERLKLGVIVPFFWPSLYAYRVDVLLVVSVVRDVMVRIAVVLREGISSRLLRNQRRTVACCNNLNEKFCQWLVVSKNTTTQIKSCCNMILYEIVLQKLCTFTKNLRSMKLITIFKNIDRKKFVE